MANPLKRVPWKEIGKWAAKALLNDFRKKMVDKILGVEKEKPKDPAPTADTRTSKP